ncbi:piRNA biogenesis protein EXD1-like [Bolinopsis microptera]|uniref:piRNA biogenesis protein EXD1-like n=1 Tax=Bolinopsis microptera TaxID=2820187 RepID=UPI003079DDB1
MPDRMIHVLDSASLFQEACLKLTEDKILAVDCEGLNLGRNGTLDIISVFSTSRLELFLFDITSVGSQGFDNGLRDLFENPLITKLMFDCRQDTDALYHIFGVNIDGLVDVQLMDVFHSLNKQPKDRLPARSAPNYWSEVDKSITRVRGLGACIQTILGNEDVQTEKRNVQVMMQSQPQNIWCIRPLPKTLADYCLEDVKYLFDLYYMYMSYGVCIEKVKSASIRYRDYIKAIPKTDNISKFVCGHNLLPHNILEVEPYLGQGTQCKGCFKRFNAREFKKDLGSSKRFCRVCRKLDSRPKSNHRHRPCNGS